MSRLYYVKIHIKLLIIIYLYIWFASEAYENKQYYRYDIVIETGPIVNMKYSHKGSHQHKEYSSWS